MHVRSQGLKHPPMTRLQKTKQFGSSDARQKPRTEAPSTDIPADPVINKTVWEFRCTSEAKD